MGNQYGGASDYGSSSDYGNSFGGGSDFGGGGADASDMSEFRRCNFILFQIIIKNN